MKDQLQEHFNFPGKKLMHTKYYLQESELFTDFVNNYINQINQILSLAKAKSHSVVPLDHLYLWLLHTFTYGL